MNNYIMKCPKCGSCEIQQCTHSILWECQSCGLWADKCDYLSKVEPTYGNETVDDILEEIQEHQKSINVLLNRLGRKTK